MSQILGFVIGLVGEELVSKWIAKIQLWYAKCVAEELKAKVDDEYNRIFEVSKALGQIDPPPPPST